jgi:hypothetical protein
MAKYYFGLSSARVGFINKLVGLRSTGQPKAAVATSSAYSAGFFGGSSPRCFMTICKSFQASLFWRGSRRRNAGW